jgi:hypothetical protein
LFQPTSACFGVDTEDLVDGDVDGNLLGLEKVADSGEDGVLTKELARVVISRNYAGVDEIAALLLSRKVRRLVG